MQPWLTVIPARSTLQRDSRSWHTTARSISPVGREPAAQSEQRNYLLKGGTHVLTARRPSQAGDGDGGSPGGSSVGAGGSIGPGGSAGAGVRAAAQASTVALSTSGASSDGGGAGAGLRFEDYSTVSEASFETRASTA